MVRDRVRLSAAEDEVELDELRQQVFEAVQAEPMDCPAEALPLLREIVADDPGLRRRRVAEAARQMESAIQGGETK